jgi:hypothetical protein
MAFPGVPVSRASRVTASDPQPSPPSPTDWPKQATETIVTSVDWVRDRTTGPAVTAARVVVYGTVLGLLAIPLAVISLIFLMRISEHFLLWLGDHAGWTWLSDPMWIVYLFYGLVFVLGGAACWRRASKAPTATA